MTSEQVLDEIWKQQDRIIKWAVIGFITGFVAGLMFAMLVTTLR